jgi:hypothetical protein
MHVQVKIIDEHDGLCVPGRMLKIRVGLSQSAGEVDQHGQEPALAIGELAQFAILNLLKCHHSLWLRKLRDVLNFVFILLDNFNLHLISIL